MPAVLFAEARHWILNIFGKAGVVWVPTIIKIPQDAKGLKSACTENANGKHGSFWCGGMLMHACIRTHVWRWRRVCMLSCRVTGVATGTPGSSSPPQRTGKVKS